MFNNKMNIQQFVGRLVKDPQLKTTSNGKLLMVFPFAYNTANKTDANGSTANYLDVEAWEKLADFHAPRLKKGMEIIILGNLVQRRWKDAEQKTRSTFKLVARAISVSDLKRRPEPDFVRQAA
ncbi:MAG: single-stranded DNA-binding protein [Leptospiraceae bacterium]|nr:single-stranded DNA-binding protein [Leptospiraceae bacterium]